MGGCTNCSGKTGCNDRKHGMLGQVQQWLERLYPSRSWGALDDEVAMVSGVSSQDLAALAEELSTELKAAAIVRPGADEDLCDFIYLLCQGREPCALQMRYGDVPMPEELSESDVLSEFYLRIALSSVAPLAVVQQVAVQLSCVEGAWILREETAAGVYDAPLLRRFQRLVAILPAYGLTHVDMGEISQAPEGFSHGDYEEFYGRAPHTVNYLFFRSPSTMSVTSTLFNSP